MKSNENYRHALALIERDDFTDYATVALVEAQLAVAYELRTANILAAQATPGWLDEARERLGHPTAPIKDFSTPRPVPVVKPDQRCSKQLMDGRNEIRCWLKTHHEGDCK